MVEIDHSKSINDTWRHDIGDIALKEVASVMSKAMRKTYVISRIGGEEFALIFPENIVSEGLIMVEIV